MPGSRVTQSRQWPIDKIARKENSAVKNAAKQTSSPRQGITPMLRFGALCLIGILSACNTTKPKILHENKTAVSNLGSAPTAAQSDYATNPIDAAPSREAPAKSTDPVQPWLVLKSIGFFYDRADLAGWEAIKITEIVTYVALHPEVELGINRPAVAADGDPKIDDLNHRRVRTIINRLMTAGVSEDRIQVGNYRNLPLSLDQQVEVFVRRSL